MSRSRKPLPYNDLGTRQPSNGDYQQPTNLQLPQPDYHYGRQRQYNDPSRREELGQIRILDPSGAKVGPTLPMPKPQKSMTPAKVVPKTIVSQPVVPKTVVPQPEATQTVITQPIIQPQVVHLISLTHYHITGGKGWQKIFGYVKGTDVQPIQAIKSGVIQGISFSHSGIDPIPSGPFFICKNVNPETPISETNPSVMAIIQLKSEIANTTNFTLVPNENIEQVSWESKSVQFKRNDKLSVYGENLTGANIELYVEYA